MPQAAVDMREEGMGRGIVSIIVQLSTTDNHWIPPSPAKDALTVRRTTRRSFAVIMAALWQQL